MGYLCLLFRRRIYELIYSLLCVLLLEHLIWYLLVSNFSLFLLFVFGSRLDFFSPLCSFVFELEKRIHIRFFFFVSLFVNNIKLWNERKKEIKHLYIYNQIDCNACIFFFFFLSENDQQ